jgi:ribosomal protein L37AE/L43A
MDYLTLFDERFGNETFQTCSNGQIKKRCPECNHKSLSCNINLGVYNCFQCTYAGKLEVTIPVDPVKLKKNFSKNYRQLS